MGEYNNKFNIILTILMVSDLDMNRIESITILKDAASKAIYGSKAAHGVVVIETIGLGTDGVRVNYTGNVDIEMPDHPESSP